MYENLADPIETFDFMKTLLSWKLCCYQNVVAMKTLLLWKLPCYENFVFITLFLWKLCWYENFVRLK
jgi:hypothetical protein